MFGKVLVANRGEIAVRIIRALEELGVASVAVYSEIDRGALHARRAQEAYLLEGGYLDVDRLLDVVRECGAEAVHPGYGFLAENASFAQACEDAGIVFIGPPASAIEAMGSKTRARELMQAAGVPIVPGTTDPVPDLDAARTAAREIGYPVAVKAAGGGGGKGFRVAMAEHELRGPSRARPVRASASSPIRPSTWSATSPTRATWRCRSSPTPTATRCIWASATARSSAAIRSSSRSPPPRSSTTRCASGSGRSPPTPRRPSATAAPEPSKACSRTATTSSWR
jgi:hypothetical protein